jgi:hypothetical protein
MTLQDISNLLHKKATGFSPELTQEESNLRGQFLNAWLHIYVYTCIYLNSYEKPQGLMRPSNKAVKVWRALQGLEDLIRPRTAMTPSRTYKVLKSLVGLQDGSWWLRDVSPHTIA